MLFHSLLSILNAVVALMKNDQAFFSYCSYSIKNLKSCLNISFFWSCFPIFLLFSVNICACFFKLILQWFIGKSRMKINSLQQRYLLQNPFYLTFVYHLNALKMMKIESPFSAGKQLKVRCRSSVLKNFFSKGWALQAEVILFQK